MPMTRFEAVQSPEKYLLSTHFSSLDSTQCLYIGSFFSTMMYDSIQESINYFFERVCDDEAYADCCTFYNSVCWLRE